MRKLLKHSRYIRYGLFIVTLFVMIASIKVYLNNFSIELNINETKSEIVDFEQKTLFKDKFYAKYLSELSWFNAEFFTKHEKNILLPWEKVIKLIDIDAVRRQQEQEALLKNARKKEEIIDITNPKDAWMYFIKMKIETM